jgi:hypothetical protein
MEPRAAAWERQLRALPRRVPRALQRHFAVTLAELALLLALWQGPAWAVLINVDGTTCTLAAAITAANTDAAAGGCPAGSGADTLVRPADGDGVGGPACDIGAVEMGATDPPVVTSPFSFVALPDSFSSTTDGVGCPPGVDAGKFFFQALLTNENGLTSLQALKAQVAELTNGNLLLTADEEPGGRRRCKRSPSRRPIAMSSWSPRGRWRCPS